MESIFECLILQNLARNDSFYCLLSPANLDAITLPDEATEIDYLITNKQGEQVTGEWIVKT
ncbi:MAG: hypothetical protein WBM44_16975, partial [Waterburya sp.]